MSELRDEPPQSLGDLREILLQQLSYYRASLLAKLDGLTHGQLTASVLPSGWSPLELQASGLRRAPLDAMGLRSRAGAGPVG
jgi:hypothetical protein